MPQAFSHCAIACKSWVNVSNTRTGCSSRSGGTATKVSRAPISIPAALGSRQGRSSKHIPFRLLRRPDRLVIFGWQTLPCFLSSGMGHSSGSRQRPDRAHKDTLWIGINLHEVVTTGWRTKPGTRLSTGLQQLAPLTQRPTSAAGRLLQHASGGEGNQFLCRMETHCGTPVLQKLMTEYLKWQRVGSRVEQLSY